MKDVQTLDRIIKKIDGTYEMTRGARDEQKRFTPMILYVIGFGAVAQAATAIMLTILAIKLL